MTAIIRNQAPVLRYRTQEERYMPDERWRVDEGGTFATYDADGHLLLLGLPTSGSVGISAPTAEQLARWQGMVDEAIVCARTKAAS